MTRKFWWHVRCFQHKDRYIVMYDASKTNGHQVWPLPCNASVLIVL